MKAKREITGHKTVMVEKLVPVEEIVLTLSMKEARVLMAVCGRISGQPDGPRGVFSNGANGSILRALEEAGVTEANVVKDGSLRLDSAHWTND